MSFDEIPDEIRAMMPKRARKLKFEPVLNVRGDSEDGDYGEFRKSVSRDRRASRESKKKVMDGY